MKEAPMNFICAKHGSVEAEPNANLDVFCPRCYQEAVEQFAKDPPITGLVSDISMGCSTCVECCDTIPRKASSSDQMHLLAKARAQKILKGVT